MDGSSNRIVPMRLFANWETDRTITSAVQRMFSMALTRLIFSSFPEPQSTLVITVKLQGSKRSLRSNDFIVHAKNGKVDTDLNISFVIQYPHFLKRKGNVLQILLQRRKRYKNRPILGYKTLAIGTINLSEVLQNSSLRELQLYDPELEIQPSNVIGRLLLASCQSQAFEVENEVRVQRVKEKEIESEEDDDSSTDMQESDNEHEFSAQKRRIKSREKRQQNIARRKNLKQKFASLIKKFKLPEDDAIGSVSQAGSVAPTAQELEELFEELENLSDSGPEMIMDNLSIVSNPRPGLRPYFASHEIFPPITDDKDNSEESESDEDCSTDIDNLVDGGAAIGMKAMSAGPSQHTFDPSAQSASHVGLSSVPASATVGSFTVYTHESDFYQNSGAKYSVPPNTRAAFANDLLTLVIDEEPWNPSERLWICNSTDLPIPISISSCLRIIDCKSYNECRILISSIVAKIQKFCNSSSSSPPCTVLGVIGSEKLVSNILRAYVEALQNKTADWINFLRFYIVVPLTSTLGKVLLQLSSEYNSLNEIFTKSPDEITATDAKVYVEKLKHSTDGCVRKLPIGEAMLQRHSKGTGDDKDTSQFFVPLLSEVRIGQSEEDFDCSISSPRHFEETAVLIGNPVNSPVYSSPPLSPHGLKTVDSQDLQIEYWISPARSAEVQQIGNLNGSSNVRESATKRESHLLKSSIRSAFRSFTVYRKHSSTLLYLQFIKEKRRDKMFHKLGMKKIQRNDSEAQTPIQCINNVARLICSGKHPLKVSIDGCVWRDVRYFQISAQWQTHVKFFPIYLPTEL